MTRRKEQLAAFERLLDIMDELREKCPWDKKQTLDSLRPLTIEETYELADAILGKNTADIKGELGDLLLHIVFYAKIGSETNDFDMADVIDGICDKLIKRHPHIYGDIDVDNEADVKKNWERLKLKNGKTSVLQGVPKSLPALVKAWRIQEKVSGVGFDWDHKNQVFSKIEEELQEFHHEIASQNPVSMESEFGDVLFSLINYARFININPENALERTNKKFIKRFQYMERQIKHQNKDINDLSVEQMDALWNEAKQQ